MSVIYEFFTSKSSLWLVLIIALVVSALIAVFIEPLRRQFFRTKEYDVTDENPWDEIMGEKSPKNKKKKK